MKSTTIPLGGISLIDKVEKDFGLISGIFGKISGKAKDMEAKVKLLLYNRLTYAVSVHRILDAYPDEAYELLGFKKAPSERSLYRTLEIIGKNHAILLEGYQNLLAKYKLVDKEQIFDITSTYFEGENAELARFGYSRDRRGDRKQVTIGISTGINEIPCAITVQKGNVHYKLCLYIISRAD